MFNLGIELQACSISLAVVIVMSTSAYAGLVRPVIEMDSTWCGVFNSSDRPGWRLTRHFLAYFTVSRGGYVEVGALVS